MTEPVFAARPDWDQVKARFTAFWDMEPTDRPCLDIVVYKQDADLSMRPCETTEDMWFDPEWVTDYLSKLVDARHYLGEAFPHDGAKVLMTGWTLGCSDIVRFSPDTIWHEPVMGSIDDHPKWMPGDADPWRQKTEKLLRHLLKAAKGHFVVTYPYQLPLNDIFSMLTGSETMMLNLADDPVHCGNVLMQRMDDWIENLEYFRRIVDVEQEGCFWGCPGMWSPEFTVITQSDISCMIGSAMFEQFVIPELDVLGERYERVWYHLDGKGARRHLPRLLQLPYIKAVQYVPSPDEPWNGPAHLDLYRQIQNAGRCVDLYVAWDDMEALIKGLKPEGLVLRTAAPSLEAAQELIDHTAKWSGSDIHTGS
ncbi:MAG: hypothetical protein ACYC27_05665 [Armatimonadota bacterium]